MTPRRIVLTLLAIVLGTLGLFAAALTWGPDLARDLIARQASEWLGRTVQIGPIESRPWRGELTLSRLSLAQAGKDAPQLAIERIHLRLDPRALLHRQVRLHEIAIEQPTVSLRMDTQGRLDIQDVLERFAPDPSKPSGPDWVWHIGQLDLQRGAGTFADDRVKAVFELADLRVEGKDIAALGDAGQISISAIVQGAGLRSELRIATPGAMPRLQGTLELKALDTRRIVAWLPLPADLVLNSGLISLAADARFDASAPASEQLHLAGQVRVESLELGPAATTPARSGMGLTAKEVVLDLAESQPLAGAIRIRSIALEGPVLSSGREPHGRLSWPDFTAADRAANAPPANAPPANAPPASALPASERGKAPESGNAAVAPGTGSPSVSLTLEQLRVRNGEVRWNDQALNKPLQVGLDRIVLEARDILWPRLDQTDGLQGQVSVTARIDRDATLQVSGALKANTIDGEVTASRLPIERWLPVVLSASDPQIRTAPVDLAGKVRWEGATGMLALEGARLKTASWQILDANRSLARAQASEISRLDARWQDGRLDIQDLQANFRQLQSLQDPALPEVTLQAQISGLSSTMNQALPVQATVSLGDSGRLAIRGGLRPSPLQYEGSVTLQALDLALLQTYADPYLNLVIEEGRAWGTGRLQVAQSAAPADRLRLSWQGDASVNGFRATDKVTGEPLLSIGALAMPGVQLQWSFPSAPEDRIETSDIALVDFYARVILDADGRLNLSRVLADPATDGAAPVSLTQASSASTLASAPQSVPSPTPAAASSKPLIRLGTIRLASGRVDFTDRFIKPNYSANLVGLSGAITPLTRDPRGPAEVVVTGQVDGDTPLEINGQLNLLADPQSLDLRAVARGFDLPKLSPYSGKWAGYAIEKGKLTATLRYQLQGDQLQAENRIVINQLTFGEPVDSPDALKIPVKFAISLLKDANGVIDLDLPISGTISDPQFSVGGLIWRAIGNLLIKVVSAPFNALASLARSDLPASDLSHVAFDPGSSELDESDQKRLSALAQALAARPELSLELIGHADPISDREAMTQRRLREMLERNRQPMTAALEKALLERAKASDEDLRELAQERAQNARRVLRDTHGIANERLFLIAPRLLSTDDSKPARRVDFEIKQD